MNIKVLALCLAVVSQAHLAQGEPPAEASSPPEKRIETVSRETTVTATIQGGARNAKEALAMFEQQVKSVQGVVQEYSKNDPRVTSRSVSVNLNSYGAIPTPDNWTYNGTVTFRVDSGSDGAEIADSLAKKGIIVSFTASENRY